MIHQAHEGKLNEAAVHAGFDAGVGHPLCWLTGLGNARPPGIGRNTLQGGGVTSFDVLNNHDFHLSKPKGDDGRVLSVGVSAFNVFNRTNYTTYIGALSSSRFEQPTTALAGRQIQLSVGYSF